ncbi:hypothetical protein DIPPA_27009 [Diplonema papillatum]|nr:hypothetical protein DIPPA_27009 [Diplonema papillatum]
MADAESSVDVRVEDDGAGARWQSPDYFCGLLWSQVLTISFLVLHFLRPLVAAVVSITWIHDNQDRIGDTRVVFYRMFTGIGGIVFVLVTSVFYMWSLRGYDSKQIESRRVRGIVVNFLCSDLPLFGVECNIIINFGFDSTLLAISFGLTTISFFYSAMRVWVFAMERFIKHTDRPYLHGNRPLLDTSTSPNRYQPPSDHRGIASFLLHHLRT